MSMPPDVGKPLSVRVDADLYYDLATVIQTGVTASDAVRHALRLLADTYRKAWDYGDCPDGTAPQIVAVQYARPTPSDARTTPSDASTTPVGQPG